MLVSLFILLLLMVTIVDGYSTASYLEPGEILRIFITQLRTIVFLESGFESKQEY